MKKQAVEQGGQLEVGTDGAGKVVIKHCDAAFIVDSDARGWIAFWPEQARILAGLLLRHAREAEGEHGPVTTLGARSYDENCRASAKAVAQHIRNLRNAAAHVNEDEGW